MDEITLTINDQEVKAKKGMTILEAARVADIFIPTLCHHEKLSAYGACRLCVVEIVREEKSQIVASCLYPVEDSLNICHIPV